MTCLLFSGTFTVKETYTSTYFKMDNRNVSDRLKPPSQGRYAWITVVVLGLVSVIVFGASFFNESVHRQGTMSLRSEGIPEPDSFEMTQQELPRMLKPKRNNGKKRPNKSSNDDDKNRSPTSTPVSTPTIPTAMPVAGPTAMPVVVPTAMPVVVPTAMPVVPTAKPACQMQQYTLADIAPNNSAAKCWMNLYGVVYNLSSYVAKHPGGSIILKQCGTDATTNFNNQHGVQILQNKGFSAYIIGRLGSSSGTVTVPCSDVKLVAVTGARRD
jgi:cytochrome b involved in lipid metabolism